MLTARWTEALLGQPTPEEPRSTCSTCPMIGAEGPFRVDVRCCGFLPALPNFLVGGVLADPGLPEGKATVRARIAGLDGVGPLGLDRPAAYIQAHAGVPFGSAPSLRCPHYADPGLCTIWPYREGICSTWFCRIDGGEAGKTFWREQRALLGFLEQRVARHCARELGLAPIPGEGLGWEEAMEDWYVACWELAEGLSVEALKELGGLELRMRRRGVRAARADLQ